MKTTRLFVAICGIASAFGPLSAQTTIPSNDVVKTGSWITTDINFVTDKDGTGNFVTQNQLAGLESIDVTLPGGGTVSAWDMCSEFHIGPVQGPYSVTAGFGPLGSAAESDVRALISNAFPLFDAARVGGSWDDAAAYGSAIQIVLWEIVDDNNQQLIIDSANPLAGIFQVDLSHTSGDANTPVALAHAGDFLTNIRSGTWTDQGGINYYYADASPNQDRFWFTTGTEIIPEPAAVALIIIGLTLGLRRRRV